jgi:maltokinase
VTEPASTGLPANLAAAVRAADPAVLLPPRRAGEERRLVRPLSLQAAVALPTGRSEAYACVVADAVGTLVAGPFVLSGQAVRRAEPGDGAAAALVRLVAGGASVGNDFRAVQLGQRHAGSEAGESGIAADQTHDSVVVGASGADAVVVKWAVETHTSGVEPAAVAAVRHLSAAGFAEMPAPQGFLLSDLPAGTALVASVAQFLPGAEDGWDWCVNELLDACAGRTEWATLLATANRLGALVARMHVAFATPCEAFPTPVVAATPEEVTGWYDRAASSLDEAVEATGGEPGERLRALAPAARQALGALQSLAGTRDVWVARVHGDLHVGQVLRWAGGYAVADFDGNPVLPEPLRSGPQPPARDVAGMLRAVDHVGRIVDRRTSGANKVQLDAWTGQSRAALLDAYLAELAAAGQERLFDARLLHAFEVEQECREFVYAARHLPRWTYVPDAALGPLLAARAKVRG